MQVSCDSVRRPASSANRPQRSHRHAFSRSTPNRNEDGPALTDVATPRPLDIRFRGPAGMSALFPIAAKENEF
jgi:hypothetical protein